jgi:hypothetical protein
MLPEQQPHPTRPYPMDHGTQPPDAAPDQAGDRIVAANALTLFFLGVMVGLLAVVARIAHEAQHSVLIDATRNGLSWMTVSTRHSSLPPMIHDLDDPLVRMIGLGFVLGIIGIVSGAGLWLVNGKPVTPREWCWTWIGAWIVLFLATSVGAALFAAESHTRITLLSVSFALALAGFIMLVILVVRDALRRPPP